MVADLASIRENVEIGEYTIVGRGVTVENKVKIGKRCKLETESYITALSEIEDGCFIAPEVTFTNDNFLGRTKERFKFHKGVTVKRGGRIGANVTVLPGITIGADALVAAGSVVTRDVPARKLVMGSPAKVKTRRSCRAATGQSIVALHFLSIVGARPQFVKAAMVADAIREHNRQAAPRARIRHTLVHTGQHYDKNLSDVFFHELPLPKPKHHLGVGSGSHGKQTAALLERIEQVLLEERPDVAIVYGDTNSTVAGALAAAKLKIRIAHIEAGLRSFNRLMPEELNRVATDHLSDLLFCPTDTAVRNLKREGITNGVFLTGDVMLDAVLSFRAAGRKTFRTASGLGLKPAAYILLTIHRAENTDSAEQMVKVVGIADATEASDGFSHASPDA